MNNFKMKKNKVCFYSSVKDISLFKTQKFYQIDISILKRMGYEVIVSNNIFDAFKFWKYNFVFAYFYRYSFFFALIALILGRRTYFTGGIDALDIEYAGRKQYIVQKLLFILCYTIAKKCIIVSKTDLKHVEEIVGIGKSKIVFSEHSIDMTSFLCKSINKKEHIFTTIGWMGSIGNVKRKGIDKALFLFSLLKKEPFFSDCKFVLMGREGIGTTYLREIIEKLGISNSVIITGEISEQRKIDLLLKSKYYFQLSSYEGFGIAALEALIAGNIIIHSGKGGLDNPIYSKHIRVDINKDILEQIESIKMKLSIISDIEVMKNMKECSEYYDNDRRMRDFYEIIKF